jgi:hypothetical protein
MSHGNPAARERTPDTQTLVTLLEDLMPLLLSIQQGQPFAQQLPQPEPGNLLLPNAMLDHQAAVNLVEDITADPLRRLSTYLEAYAEQHAELQSCVGTVTHAVHAFAARDYAQTFGLIWQAYRTIAALRAINPQLPPLRAVGPANSSTSPPNTSIH